MGDDLEKEKEEEEKKEKEYKRWQGYASALLIALTVLFAGTVIGLPEVAKGVVIIPILSTMFGVAGIVLTVLWFALEDRHKIKGKPAFLVWASRFFGCQVGFLFVALSVSYLGT